jgi:hypothetical protein
MLPILTLILCLTFLSPASAEVSAPSFTLSQAVQTLELEKKDYETLYRTDLVPDTCYRSETQGYRSQCHTEYDRQCHTELNQQCGFRYYPVCHTAPRSVCTPRQICHRGSGGGTTGGGNRPPVCRTETQCQTVYDRVCRNEQRYECWSHPQTYCNQVPRPVCNQVPNIVQVPYSCTKPVQVAIGQNLRLQTNARVSVHFENFNEIGPLSDTLFARLEGNEVRLSGSSERVLYRVVRQSFTEQRISENARILEVDLFIRAITADSLNAFSLLEIRKGRIERDRVSFELSRSTPLRFRVHLSLHRHRALARDLPIVDAHFDSSQLMTEGGLLVIPLNRFGAGPLKPKRYTARIRINLDGEFLRQSAVNPDLLTGVRNPAIESTFEVAL